jgi:hypothetical protein
MEISAFFYSMLKEVECFVGRICFLLQRLTSRLGFFVFVDRCQVNVRIRSFKILHLLIEPVLLQLGTHFAEVLTILC